MNPTVTIGRDLHRARHGAAAMRKQSRRYAESGAQWLARDAARRAVYLSRQAREYVRRLRILSSIAARAAANSEA